MASKRNDPARVAKCRPAYGTARGLVGWTRAARPAWCRIEARSAGRPAAVQPTGRLSARQGWRALAAQLVAGAEDPPHHDEAQHEEADDREHAGAHVDVGDAVEAPAESADQVHH